MKQRSVITVEVSPGELLDRITILEVKAARITDPAKLRNVGSELATLQAARDRALTSSPELDGLAAELKSVNEALWDIENEIRSCERRQDFGSRFVELARSVYVTNDRRSAIKRQINSATGSRLVEEKSYPEY